MSAKQEISDDPLSYDKTENGKPILYVVDDDQSIGEFIAYAAEEIGFEVHVLCSAQELQDKWATSVPDLVVLDIIMPGTDGVELVGWLATKHCELPVVLMSGYDARHIRSASNLACALKINIVATIQKPIALVALETLFGSLKEQISGSARQVA